MRILLVEDDARLAQFVIKGLSQEGMMVDHALDGEEGLNLAMFAPYDMFLVDLMLPKRDGLSLIAAIRAKKNSTPVIVLSARDSVDDRVRGLQVGGDDYLVKPFAFAELVARIQALQRRVTGLQDPASLSVADLQMNVQRHKVQRAGQAILLQPKEFVLLEFLMRHVGHVVSKTMIMEHVWDFNFDPNTNVVEARVSRLREKIDRPFETNLIHTVRGVGYVLEERT